MPTPLVSNPVAIFLIVLVIIMLAPVLLNKLKIPHIIGLIIAGVIVGPYGFNVLADDSSFTIFGQVGLLYLMFLAGIEIDMYHLKLNLRRGLGFGLLTFFIPLIMGSVGSVYLLHLNWLTAVLLGSVFASHTLIAYPVVARYGISKSPAVMISVVATIIAVVGALLVLGGAVNIHAIGSLDPGSMAWLFTKMAIYCIAVLYCYPRITRWFFKRFIDNVTQYVFVLSMVFLSAYIAKEIGLESVLGAFFAGLVLNRYIPSSSTLMNRIEFVGNALFIPYFLISVGMMINVRVIANTDTIIATVIMLAIALSSKWLPAFAAQKIYKMDGDDRRIMFGLTTAHTAVALAVVTIGYNMMMPDGTRMMDETVLNGTILVILITCAIAPIVTSSAASKIKVKMLSGEVEETATSKRSESHTLVAVSNPLTAGSLVELALLTRPERRNRRDTLFGLNVRNDNSPSSKAMGRNVIDIALKASAAMNYSMTTIERYDLNTVTGIVNAIEERDINEVYVGMHRRTAYIDSFFGAKIEQLLKMTNRMVVISRCYIPINTVTRIAVYVPPQAQFETGFTRWLHALANLTRELGCRIIFCCPDDIRRIIGIVLRRDKYAIRCEYRRVENRDDFLLLANRVLDDDLFVIISARPTSVSYSSEVAEIPDFIKRNFQRNNILFIYPEQFGADNQMESFADPMAVDLNTTITTAPWLRRLRGWVSALRERRTKPK